ncbi:hypothetical protein ACM64Y_11725 [Novispirillum sp. DQ9]|uniref:hypothetical protein n=1 Tax=Novispirillum sp. DQ9 TaxID=3398612 RepID=UPI003C7CD69A
MSGQRLFRDAATRRAGETTRADGVLALVPPVTRLALLALGVVGLLAALAVLLLTGPGP